MPVTVAEILDEQGIDEFCKEIISGKGCGTSGFVENEDGVLRRVSLDNEENLQSLIPEVLRPKFPNLTHHSKSAEHPGQERVYAMLNKRLYGLHMSANVTKTVNRGAPCARNILQLRKGSNQMQLFPARAHVVSVGVDNLGLLPKSKRGKRFLQVITDLF